MARYFFHLEDGHLSDDKGDELPNDGAARDEALRVARDLTKNRTGGKRCWVIATDLAGAEVARVPAMWQV